LFLAWFLLFISDLYYFVGTKLKIINMKNSPLSGKYLFKLIVLVAFFLLALLTMFQHNKKLLEALM